MADSREQSTSKFPITEVDDSGRWFAQCGPPNSPANSWKFILEWRQDGQVHRASTMLELVHHFYNKKIGEVAGKWKKSRYSSKDEAEQIEYYYAKIKLGDVFDYYTTADGVLKVPTWVCFKYAVDEYLENDPRIKFHPSRVSRFIEERSVEQLEEIQ